jgi:phosphate transport system substrate-binding protein
MSFKACAGVALKPARRPFTHRGRVLASFLIACFAGYSSPFCRAQETVTLVGSGSTLPLPLYTRLAEEFNKRNSKIQMRYLPLSTSEGIRNLSHGQGDFAAGEMPLPAKERAEGNLMEVPVALIAIVPIYNLPGIKGDLRFSGDVLADIFLGRLTTWNSPALAKLNPGVSLPDLPIKVVIRPGGKGTNYVFTDFLSKASPRFRAKIGTTPSPDWPVGEHAERSLDMTNKVASLPGSIGYVEVEYAMKFRVSFGAVLNPAGRFVKASPDTIAAACSAVEAPEWNKLSPSLTNPPGPNSYPIVSFTWLYLRPEADGARAAALTDLVKWILQDKQQIAIQEGYVTLPPELRSAVENRINAAK